jgi:peptidoglycan/xylan/chitin deacetylase (PgdA/CDA1 family)
VSKPFYLTFDGAPNPPGTDRILKVLEKHGIKGTFFMEGKRLEKEANCALRVLQAGHDIGNHSYNHPDFSSIPLEACIEEVDKAERILFAKLGIKTRLLRPPAGRLTPEVEKALLNLGYTIVLWSYSVKDWEGPDAQSVAERTLEQLKDGAVVVFHDHVEWVPDTLEIIVPEIKKRGYIFKTISEHPIQGKIK